MIRSHIYGVKLRLHPREELALLFGNAGKPFQFLGVYNRQVQSSLCAVVEEDGVDDLAGSGGETEGDVGDAEDSFDIRDLLLDETD